MSISIDADGSLSGSQLISTISNQPPLIVQSSQQVTNLNTQYLSGQGIDYYTNANNIQDGTLSAIYGGTGLTNSSTGQLIFGQGSNSQLGQTSNLIYNSQTNQLNIGGSVNISGNLQVSGCNITKGGNGVSNIPMGYIIYGMGSNSAMGDSNFYWDSAAMRLGINTSNPQYSVDVVGSINVTGNVLVNGQNVNSGLSYVNTGGTGLTSIGVGLIPFGSNSNTMQLSSNFYYDNTNQILNIQQLQVSNSILVSNLNVQYLNSNPASYYLSASNITQGGQLGVTYGGTGISNITPGYIPFGQGTNSIGISSNLFWNSSQGFLGIGTSNPASQIHVIGNILGSSNITATNQFISSTTTLPPFVVNSAQMVSNLNVQLFSNCNQAYYLALSNQIGTLSVTQGGTGLNSITQGFIPFGQGTNGIGLNSNLFWDSTNNRLGINISSPQSELHVVGNIICQSNITIANQVVISSASNVPPLVVQSTNLVSNLNAQLFNNCNQAYYLSLSNQTGTLNVIQGGTGLNLITQGYIPFGQGINGVGISSNLFWDSTNKRLGINISNPQSELHVVGNITCQSNITIANQVIVNSASNVSPLVVSSSNLVTNLNAQLFSNCNQAYYLSLSNQTGTLSVTQGGTGLNSLTQGYVPFGQGTSQFSGSSNLFWDSANKRLGINISNPQSELHVVGNITCQSNITTANQVIINSTSNVSPLVVSSSNLITNLNAQLFSNCNQAYYLSLSNQTGTLSVAQGGTGLNSITQGYIPFGQGINGVGISSNLFWDSTNKRLGINISNPQSELHVVGNITCQSNITIANQVIINSASNVSPLVVSSSNLVTNLNAQLFSNCNQAYYLSLSNQTGTLSVTQGGTGLNSLTQGYVPFGQGTSQFSGSSNLFWDNINFRVGVRTQSPLTALHVNGSAKANSLIADSNTTVSIQGLHLQWNRGVTDGATYIMNQKGTGTGGIQFGEIDQSNNFTQTMILTSNGYLGIGTSNPTSQLHVFGNITGSSNMVLSNQLFINSSSNVSPLVVSSTNLVSNLNAQLFSNCNQAYYLSLSNQTGILSVTQGGTGINSLTQGYIPFGQGTNNFNSSSNLFWNISSNFLGIGTTNPSNAIDIAVGGLSIRGMANSNIQIFTSNNSEISYYVPNSSSIKWSMGQGTWSGISNFGLGNTYLNSAALVCLFSNGYIGIGNSNPQQMLDVNGNVNIRGNIIISGQIIDSTSNSQSNSSNSISNITVSNNIVQVTSGGTGVSNIQSGFLLFGQGSSSIGSTSNLFFNTTSNYLGINTCNPQAQLDVNGQIRSSLSQGTAPFVVQSSSLVANLNVQYLGGFQTTYYLALSNQQGILSIQQGGTGLGTLTQGYIPFGQGTNALGNSPNLVWNSQSNYLGINNSNPQNSLDVVGNTQIKGNLTVTGNIYITGVSSSNTSSSNSNLSNFVGTLSVNQGGTGLNALSQGYIPFGQGSNQLGATSNLFWNSQSNYLGINNSNPQQPLDVTGNINAQYYYTSYPLSIAWYNTSSNYIQSNGLLNPGTWNIYSNVSKYPTGISPSNILINSNSQLVIPFNGIFQITYAIRFQNASQVENSLWLNCKSGSYSNVTPSSEILHGSSGSYNVYSSTTNYFSLNDTFSICAYSTAVSGTGSNAFNLSNYTGIFLSLTLIQRC